MPLTVSQAAQLNNKITSVFKSCDMIEPPGTLKNSEAAAWQLLIAQRMSAFADAFKKQAVKDCIAQGVLFDHTKTPRGAGIDEDVYAGNYVRVHLQTKNGSNKVDYAKMREMLIASGAVTADKWDAALAACTSQNASPHTFTASLKT